MSFRARLAMVAAAAVALAIVAASFAIYFIVKDQLRAPIDDSLRASADHILHSHSPEDLSHAIYGLRSDLGGASGYPQGVRPDGDRQLPPGATVPLPISDRDREVARGASNAFLRDATVRGTHVRMITFPTGAGAIQIVRPLTEVDHTLGRVETWLILIAGGGIAIAAALGLLVARTALTPVRRLTATAMLGALEESTRAQRQLVADASHELRTPLTSLRTNIEVLASDRTLPPGERERLLNDVVEQLGEMTTLIAELIDLARGEQHVSEPEEVRLDLVAADAVERARRNRPGVGFVTDLQESVVQGVPSTIERAVANLLDNAAKWSPPGGDVEIGVHDGTVTVRDHGPGIDEEDLPYVFDRFYRSRAARGLSGSGLGLAIVRQVALAHGGAVVAERAEGGGTRIVLRLNGNS
jgi:two-component system sensor histidine kinase MprB